ILLQAHTNLMAFYDRVDELAHSENSGELVAEAEPLRKALIEDSRRTRNALSRLPAEVQMDPTLVPALQAIEDALPAELDAITDLAKLNDWQAVRLRLENQVRPLELSTSALVGNIDREVGEKRAQALLKIRQAQRRILFIVAITAILTLLFAAFLGLAITRSIILPLGRLMEGSEALAGGDFSHRVSTTGNDEIALLGNVFNGMIVRLQDLYRELQHREAYLAEAQKLSHTGSFGWHASSGGVYWSEETFHIFECDLATKPTVELALERTHPEDRELLQKNFERAAAEKRGCDFEHRLSLPNGSIKYVRVVAHPSPSDEPGSLLFVGAVTDITESKRAEEALRQSGEQLTTQRAQLDELFKQAPEAVVLLDVQDRVLRINPEFTRIFGYQPEETVGRPINDLIAPEELLSEAETYTHQITHGKPVNAETIRRRKDGSRFPVSIVAVPISSADAQIGEYAIYRDISERRRAEEALRQSESYLAEAQRLTHTGSWVWEVSHRDAVYLSDEWYRLYEFNPADGKPNWEKRLERVYPEDRPIWMGAIERAIREKSDYDVEFRIVLAGGRVKSIHTIGHPILNAAGDLVQFVGTSTDITERKLAEEALRRSEGYLAEAQKLTRSGSWAWNVRTRDVFWSREMFRIFDYDPEKVKPTLNHFLERVHPDDRASVEDRARVEVSQKESVGSEGDFRIVRADGTIKHLHSIAHPVLNESGEVIEVVGTTMDVTGQYQARAALEGAFEEIKTLKDQLYKENIDLREEVDKVSMFEEIVGSSEPLRRVLVQVAKVAATDSTVLILGETGTGKEMIARAIHRRSKRANRAFIRVNCAAIPPTLIASELFGHEKGAFTGATQRRLGRFELADGGTIFLDEIGELPAETQSALLRVLQEREFERVGGTQSVSVDVRVLSATNRDLRAAMEAGTFRQDLFYRLNVFPIQMPSLRERADDIPLLVEYLIERYAKKAGKKIRNIDKKTMVLFQDYPWPGNIRELQNVVERAVVLCDGETFAVDETWLKRSLPREPSRPGVLSKGLGRLDETQEKEVIEAALTETGGRVSGPSGAATLLGIPRQTLESKIASLGINKHRFKSV
ncbi:MAG: sigma 54-interacting transcriptional regulator, partial [Candidatus Acidiferrum sp.]